MWDHKILSNQGVLRQWGETPQNWFCAIDVHCWKSQFIPDLTCSTLSEHQIFSLITKFWWEGALKAISIHGRGQEAPLPLMWPMKCQCQPQVSFPRSGCAQCLVCWNKLAVFEGQKWHLLHAEMEKPNAKAPQLLESGGAAGLGASGRAAGRSSGW